jgi:hypothetical protein
LSGALAEAPPAAATEPDAEPHFDVIELLFFAYRDFVSDPDRILTDYGFGRAHHRVLHFVNRQPGLTIAELLDILRITKQSLNRVLKELVEKGFIEQRPGVQDRRQGPQPGTCAVPPAGRAYPPGHQPLRRRGPPGGIALSFRHDR